MSEDVKPALDAEEWGNFLGVKDADGHWFGSVVLSTESAKMGYFVAIDPEFDGDGKPHHDSLAVSVRGPKGFLLTGEDRHALAALALHGQPFGFTREDVAALRDLADLCEKEACISDDAVLGTPSTDDARLWRVNSAALRTRAAVLSAIADRIAALLPPDVDNPVDKPLTRE